MRRTTVGAAFKHDYYYYFCYFCIDYFSTISEHEQTYVHGCTYVPVCAVGVCVCVCMQIHLSSWVKHNQPHAQLAFLYVVSRIWILALKTPKLREQCTHTHSRTHAHINIYESSERALLLTLRCDGRGQAKGSRVFFQAVTFVVYTLLLLCICKLHLYTLAEGIFILTRSVYLRRLIWP